MNPNISATEAVNPNVAPDRLSSSSGTEAKVNVALWEDVKSDWVTSNHFQKTPTNKNARKQRSKESRPPVVTTSYPLLNADSNR